MQVNNISEKLKTIRLNKQLTIESISNMLNVSKQGYSLWEQNKRNWNIDTLVKLSSILDFEMTIKDGEIIILENSSDDYIDLYIEEENNKIIKNELQNKLEDKDINLEEYNYLIKKIKYKNILNKYPLCNYLLEKQIKLFLENKSTCSDIYITKDEIERISKQNMNEFEIQGYIENQTRPFLIIYDYTENGYRVTTKSLFEFIEDSVAYDSIYFPISIEKTFIDNFFEINDEYKNSIIIVFQDEWSCPSFTHFESEHYYLNKFLILSSKFINKDIDTLDKETYKNILNFKVNFNELKEEIENESIKYDDYLAFKSNVLMNIVKDGLNYNLEIKFKEIYEGENIILDFEMLY